jgi:hypothetical protein
VDVIEEAVWRIVAAYGMAGLQVALLPSSLFVQAARDLAPLLRDASLHPMDACRPPRRLAVLFLRWRRTNPMIIAHTLNQLGGVHRLHAARGTRLVTTVICRSLQRAARHTTGQAAAPVIRAPGRWPGWLW